LPQVDPGKFVKTHRSRFGLMPKLFSAETSSDRMVPIVGSRMGCAGIARLLRQSAGCLQRHHRHHEGRVPEV